MDNSSLGGTAGAAQQMFPFTVANLTLIAVFAVLAILVIWWGVRTARRRREAEQAMEARTPVQYVGADVPVAAPSQTPPPAEPMLGQEEELPVAADTRDEPIAAAGAFDANPAALAADATAAPAPGDAPVAPEPTSTEVPAAIPAAPAPIVPEGDGGDDLTRMKGVGPKLAQRLREAGVTRFSQIAALTPDEAAALDAQLGDFRGRLARDRWIEQARYLAADDRAGYEAAFGKL